LSLIRCSRSSELGCDMFGHWFDTVDRQRGMLRRLGTGQTQWIVREEVLIRLVTGWRQSIVRDGYCDVWPLDGYSRSSESGF